MSCIEDTINKNGVQIEIGLHIIVTKTILRFLHLSGIEKAIVGLQMEVGTFSLPCIIFDGFSLGFCLWLVSRNELAQEGIGIGRILGHRILQRIRSIIFETHQFGFLGPQACYFNDDGKSIVCTRTICTVNRCIVDALA